MICTHRHPIGEPLEERSELRGCLLQRLISGQLLMRVLAQVKYCPAMTGILLNVVQQPPDTLLIVFVLLALNDDLRAMLARPGYPAVR